MAYSTIDKSTLHFNNKIWTGTGSENAITGIGFQPDFVWIKQRNTTRDHNVFDAVRGATKRIYPDLSVAEDTAAQVLKSFDSDGFTLGTDTSANQSSGSYVSWNWKANGAGSANTDGSINTTATSVNTTAGISICKWTGTAANATIGHGLGAAPKMIMIKNTERDANWIVYHKNLTSYSYRLNLDSNAAENNSSGSTYWTADPTASVFSIGDNTRLNANGEVQIAYCFSQIKGFSKFGSWGGNSNADGPFIYTGFKPAWVMFKRINSTGSFVIVDNKRSNSFNPQDRLLFPNTDAGEDGAGETYNWDFLSNGFKARTTSGSYGNATGDTYIYAAFAAAPLVGSNNQPASAR